MQHAEAISPIQAVPAPSDFPGNFPGGGGAGSGDNVTEFERGPSPDLGAAAQAPFVRPIPKVGRNEPCPCGSGRKYKHCHGALQQAPVDS